MPLIKTEAADLPMLDRVGPVDYMRQSEQTEPGWGAMAAAAFRQGSEIVSLGASKTAGVDLYSPDDGFTGDQMWKEIEGTAYEQYWDRFANIRNRAGMQAMKSQIDMETEDKRTLAASGGWGVAAEIGASLFSPTTLIPGGTVFRGLKLESSVAKSALSVGLSAGAAAGFQEAALGETQTARDTDVPGAIAGGVLFGSFIGAGAGALMTKAERKAAISALDAVQKPEWDKPLDDGIAELQEGVRASLSAGAVETATLDDLSIAGAAAGKYAGVKGIRNMNPILRTLQSPSVEVRRIAAQMMDNPIALKMNLAGEGEVAAETAMGRYTRGSVAQAIEAQRAAYSAMKKLGGNMSDRQFRELVGQAMRRGDQSSIPAVSEAAKAWRQHVFDPLKDRATELGMLPKDVNPRTAVSYLTRMYNRPLIEATEQQFKGVIRDWVSSGAAKEISRNPEEFAKFANKADFDDYVEEIVQSVFDHVTGKGKEGPLPKDLVITERGPLAARTLTIPDDRIEKWLEHDIELVGRRYARVMAADTELKARFGDPSMQGQLQAIADEYKRLRSKEKDPTRLAALNRREQSDMRDIRAVRDLMRGSYLPDRQGTEWARWTQLAMTFNYMRALGGMLVTNLSDAVRPAAVHGLAPFLRDGLAPLISNLKAVKISVKDAKLAGAITERALQSRVAELAEIADPYARGKPFDRFMENAANVFTKLTLMPQFTDFTKSITSVMAQTKMLRISEKAAANGFESLSQKEQAYMGWLGIGKGKAEDLGKVFAKFGEKDGDVFVANTDNWPKGLDRLKDAYFGAINKEVNRTIVTPGLGDLPLLARDPVGKALFQFRTFTMAANQRMLISGLQDGPGAFAGGLTSMVIPSMLLYWLKTVEGGREVSDNPLTWIAEGLDRSGTFGLAFEVNNAAEKLGAPGLYYAAGKGGAALFGSDDGGTASRYQSRDTMGALFPMVDLVQSAGRVAGMFGSKATDAIEGKDTALTDSQMRGIRRLLPYASLPYWRWAIDNYALPKE